MRSRHLLASTAALGLSIALVQPAFAQDEALADQAAETEAPTDAIIVTGSRIARPNLESTVPIIEVSGEEFTQTGQVSIGDVLNELPALRSTFSQANSTRFLGTSGLNLLDLRGLGTQRTLVLQNSRRHVGADVLNNAVSPDVNTIPTDLVERVEVVTGGSSSIYGSDAIAGVVNFILKRDYEGIQLRGQGGVSDYGDAGAYFVSGTAGTNFADGRGNIAVNLEYARQNDYFASQRSIRQNDAFLIVDTDLTSSSDGNPDRVFFRDVRNASLSNFGLVRFGGGNNAYRCGTDPLGLGYSCNFLFDEAGNLVPQSGTRVGAVPSAGNPTGSFIGGNGDNFRTGRQFQLSPEMNRYAVNLIGHFTFSDAFEPFWEAKYVRTETRGTGSSGPAFIQGTTLGDPAAFVLATYPNRETPAVGNPFLSDQARAVITQQRANMGLATTPNTRFQLRENLLGLGSRTEEATRETYRAVLGVRGTFSDDWNYEVSANYGEFREKTKILGNLNAQRFLLAMDAVRDPATGNIVCASKINPAAQIGYYPDVGNEANSAIFQNDVAQCVPINPFGNNITQAMRDYVLSDTTATGKITQFVVNGFVSGDSSQWFELPGGPVGFAIGAEYRRETAFYQQDPLVEAGYTFYNAIPTFDTPAFEVKEIFGEIRLPILSNVPFADTLTVNAAGRISDYSEGSTGTTYAYNAGFEWAPISDLRLRANYSRAVRAPNLTDLYTPLGQNFAPAFVDPCSANNVNTGSANRAANCLAAGIPATYNFAYSSSLELQSGGNPDLKEETSDSYTIGGVFTPSFAPGLSLTVDYYDITVNDVITTPTAQQIVNACYDLPDLDNQFCDLFQRVPAGGVGPVGEEPFRIVEGSLQQTLLNYAKLTARGIDTEVSFNRSFEGFGRVSTRLTYTHVLERSQFLDPTNPGFENRILSELGDPQDSFNWNINVESGPVTVGYQMRYIGKMVLNTYEDFFSLQGRAPENADYADRIWYPSVLYHDARVGIKANDKFEFYFGVDNLTNRMPPLGLTGIGAGSGIYDVRGRYFYAGAIAKF